MSVAKFLALMLAIAVSLPAAAETLRLPILAPVTGILAIEGVSQRNGAILALGAAPAGLDIESDFLDTASSPQIAVQAFEKALRDGPAVAVSAPTFGLEMLALMPLAKKRGVPLVTVSGTAKITEMGNPWVFRFFPSDAVAKAAQARYAVEELGRHKAAIVYQTTISGQSGRRHLADNLRKYNADVVFEEGLAPSVRDMRPVIAKLRDAKPDVVLLHLHSVPTASFIRQATADGLALPVVAGSAMHQPTTAELLSPRDLKGVCAESGSSPVSDTSPRVAAFARAYRQRFGSEPDAFAIGQYDAVTMVLRAVAAGATDADAVREALATGVHEGLVTTYKSDGKGNMMHDAVIVCYDGKTRLPAIVKRYPGAR